MSKDCEKKDEQIARVNEECAKQEQRVEKMKDVFNELLDEVDKARLVQTNLGD